jgi:hypothetical protein
VHAPYLELKIRRIIWRTVLSGVPVSGRHLSGEKALLRLVIKSERLEESEEIAHGLPRFRLGRFDPRVFPKGLKCVPFHLQVGREGAARGRYAGVP